MVWLSCLVGVFFERRRSSEKTLFFFSDQITVSFCAVLCNASSARIQVERTTTRYILLLLFFSRFKKLEQPDAVYCCVCAAKFSGASKDQGTA
jgi:hypothetical protein